MLTVRFHFPGDEDIVETFDDEAPECEVKRRAVDLRCRMYTPEIEDETDDEDPR